MSYERGRGGMGWLTMSGSCADAGIRNGARVCFRPTEMTSATSHGCVPSGADPDGEMCTIGTDQGSVWCCPDWTRVAASTPGAQAPSAGAEAATTGKPTPEGPAWEALFEQPASFVSTKMSEAGQAVEEAIASVTGGGTRPGGAGTGTWFERNQGLLLAASIGLGVIGLGAITYGAVKKGSKK